MCLVSDDPGVDAPGLSVVVGGGPGVFGVVVGVDGPGVVDVGGPGVFGVVVVGDGPGV